MKSAVKKASRIGENPLDAVLSSGPARAANKTETKSKRVPKVRAAFHLSLDLFEELRNAVVALSGPPHRLTLAAVAETALRAELERLQKTANKGRPFPQREGELRGGRPIGS